MKTKLWFGWLLVGVLVGTAWCSAVGGEAKPEAVFAEAARDYDRGEVTAAIGAYSRLVKDGYVAPELFFNLGNAYFRAGLKGLAILNYERALFLCPRDRDIRANLHFALEGAGVAAPDENIFKAYLRSLTLREWLTVAVAAYWVLAAGFVCWLWLIAWRRWFLWLVAVSGLALVLAVAGMAVSPWWEKGVAVVVGGDQKVLFAPLAGATVHFNLVRGSLVEIVEQQGDWVKVKSRLGSGWVEEAACERILAPFR